MDKSLDAERVVPLAIEDIIAQEQAQPRKRESVPVAVPTATGRGIGAEIKGMFGNQGGRYQVDDDE